MKKKNIYNKTVLTLSLAVTGLFSSCSLVDDFLTVYPTNQITSEIFWEDKNDLNSVVSACYTQFFSTVQSMFVWGEVRSDNFLLTSESNEDIKNIMNANLLPTNSWFDWAAFYTGIHYCNLCLQKGPEIVKKDASFSDSDWKPIEAELKALRAIYYFYLVRAFRDVPFVVEANDTSEGADDPVPQTASEEILTFLIKDLEEVKDNGMIDYGKDAYNTARITKNGIYAILCDLYLWRASKNSSPDSIYKYSNEVADDYRHVIDYADILIGELTKKFEEKRVDYYGSSKSPFRGDNVIPLPLYTTDKSNNELVVDVPYNNIFGEKYSLESLFEIAFADPNSNSAYTAFLNHQKNGAYEAGALSAASPFHKFSTDKPDDATQVYFKTDLRYYENIEKPDDGTPSAVVNIVKFYSRSITTDGAKNIEKAKIQGQKNGDVRSGAYYDANYILYRISDIILMKAEAVACLQQYIEGADDEEKLYDAFKHVYAVFSRSNPLIEPADDLSFDNYKSSQLLEELVLRERQRELFGEGKRWFDLVRYAMRQGNTNKMLNLLVVKYSTNSSAIKAKLATLNSLFNPVYKNELKVNPSLVQNPAWITDETIVKN